MHPLVEARHVMAVSAQGGQLAGQLTGQAVQATPPGLGQLKGPPPDLMTPSSQTLTPPTHNPHIPHMLILFANPLVYTPRLKLISPPPGHYVRSTLSSALSRSCADDDTGSGNSIDVVNSSSYAFLYICIQGS